jgi:chromosome segregation ATPase
VQLLEDDADSARTDKHHHSGSDSKLREKDRVIESLQDEISILQEQLGPLDRLLKEATSALSEQQEMVSGLDCVHHCTTQHPSALHCRRRSSRSRRRRLITWCKS